MKIETLHFGENALLAIDLLRNSVERIEKPDIAYDSSVEELVMLLDIAAHSSSRDVVQCAQQFLGFTNSMQVLFFRSVGVKLENIFASKMLANTQKNVENDAFSDELHAGAKVKWI